MLFYSPVPVPGRSPQGLPGTGRCRLSVLPPGGRRGERSRLRALRVPSPSAGPARRTQRPCFSVPLFLWLQKLPGWALGSGAPRCRGRQHQPCWAPRGCHSPPATNAPAPPPPPSSPASPPTASWQRPTATGTDRPYCCFVRKNYAMDVLKGGSDTVKSCFVMYMSLSCIRFSPSSNERERLHLYIISTALLSINGVFLLQMKKKMLFD